MGGRATFPHFTPIYSLVESLTTPPLGGSARLSSVLLIMAKAPCVCLLAVHALVQLSVNFPRERLRNPIHTGDLLGRSIFQLFHPAKVAQ